MAIEFQNKAKACVAKVANTDPEDMFIVWYCKTLQNWKAIIGTTDPVHNHRIWEVTHNGDKNETYVDEYDKARNVRVTDSDLEHFRNG